jgi:predicted metal-dependent peptidase
MIKENSIRDKEVLRYVKKALQDLMLFFPLCGLSYLGEAVVLLEDSSIETLQTDGRTVWYSPKWMAGITHDARVFDLLHEWIHIYFNHPARTGDRIRKLWNIAVDVVAVREACAILSKGGKVWNPPADGVIPPAWAVDMTAEQIYDELVAGKTVRTGTGTGETHTSEDLRFGGSYFIGDEEEFRRVFSEEIAKAAMIQEQVTGRDRTVLYSKCMARRLEEITNPKVPWNRLLQGQLMNRLGENGFATYSPPNRRFWPRIVLPTTKDRIESRLLIMIDVSASVGSTLLSIFASEVSRAAVRAKETMVVTFDSHVREVVRTKRPKDLITKLAFKSGHHTHTSSIDAFKIYDEYKPKAAVCLTDAMIMYPDKPYKDMLWVIPDNVTPPPWGRSFVMDVSW